MLIVCNVDLKMRSNYLREPAFVDSLHLSVVISNQCYERSVKYAYSIIYSPQAPNKGRVQKLKLGPQYFIWNICVKCL